MTSPTSSPLPCLACAAELGPGTIRKPPMPALHDPEGAALPAGLPPVIDAHVHLFPPALFAALWRWFEQHGWPVRYPLQAEAVVRFLIDRGVEQLVALQYPHKPGMARTLNAWLAALAADHPEVTPLASVFPGEPEAEQIVAEAFAQGHAGVKLHCHVQAFAIDDPVTAPLFELCAQRGKPALVHAGRAPSSPAYPKPSHSLCAVERVEAVLRNWPGLRLCVPHLGADELSAYAALLERHDNLWLDSTMMLAEYFPMDPSEVWATLLRRPDRVIYGSDFPNLPYAWDRELRAISTHRHRIEAAGPRALQDLLAGNARALYGLPARGAGAQPER